jgi:hypothetical protein
LPLRVLENKLYERGSIKLDKCDLKKMLTELLDGMFETNFLNLAQSTSSGSNDANYQTEFLLAKHNYAQFLFYEYESFYPIKNDNFSGNLNLIV